jgi:hypothetical protein
MTFHSILFAGKGMGDGDRRPAEPAHFADLNLDQVVARITQGREDYDLAPFFRMPLGDADAVAFRHEVLRDLEDGRRRGLVGSFAEAMREVRASLAKAGALAYQAERERWFLDAVEHYCDGVAALARGLAAEPPGSRGLTAFASYLAAYAASPAFGELVARTQSVGSELAAIRYTLLVRGLRVEVGVPGREDVYSPDIERLFERFRDGDIEPYTFRFARGQEMSQIDAMIVKLVARHYPGAFARLSAFSAGNADFLDPGVVRFDREIQLYAAVLDHIDRLRPAGLDFCYPTIVAEGEDVSARGGFDLALAGALAGTGTPVVRNDFRLAGKERIIVVTGPNQGGKTTFARAFGQMHYLASLGLPVPGSAARLGLCDGVFTHFERREAIDDARGRLKDDLVRIDDILRHATRRSVVIINEIFSSTSFRDARWLAREIAGRLVEQGVAAVWVTFIDEIAALGEETVSMVSGMAPDSVDERTFAIVRRPADGLAYAQSIARRHGLSAEAIAERLGR